MVVNPENDRCSSSGNVPPLQCTHERHGNGTASRPSSPPEGGIPCPGGFFDMENPMVPVGNRGFARYSSYRHAGCLLGWNPGVGLSRNQKKGSPGVLGTRGPEWAHRVFRRPGHYQSGIPYQKKFALGPDKKGLTSFVWGETMESSQALELISHIRKYSHMMDLLDFMALAT